MPNPNGTPENLKPFKKGQSGNPGGKTKQHRRNELRAAEIAAEVRVKALEGLLEKIAAGDNQQALEEISSDVLRLIKDSEDRAHGTPKAVSEVRAKFDAGDLNELSDSDILRLIAIEEGISAETSGQKKPH